MSWPISFSAFIKKTEAHICLMDISFKLLSCHFLEWHRKPIPNKMCTEHRIKQNLKWKRRNEQATKCNRSRSNSCNIVIRTKVYVFKNYFCPFHFIAEKGVNGCIYFFRVFSWDYFTLYNFTHLTIFWQQNEMETYLILKRYYISFSDYIYLKDTFLKIEINAPL